MASATSVSDVHTQAALQSGFEQGVAMALHLWPALTLAVQNNWGGPDSSDKRDWFAGAIVDLFPDLTKLPPSALSAPQPQQNNDEPEQIDVETVLLQVMLDEFEVNVDDESAFEVAENIMRVRGECLRGKLDEVAALRRRFEASKGKKIVGVQVKDDEDHETDWDTEDDSDESEDGDDVEMGEAPPPKENQEPEVDEDGFTKVTRKKR